ncbi:hypothetical protein BLOT_014607 [Blomia tropicalis]|nr:hypothetical protein BLOT_014607 [Blomia tropicalis]
MEREYKSCGVRFGSLVPSSEETFVNWIAHKNVTLCIKASALRMIVHRQLYLTQKEEEEIVVVEEVESNEPSSSSSTLGNKNLMCVYYTNVCITSEIITGKPTLS